ncbi:MAG: DUF4214 domain-containing protein [Clostridiales bacterium]|nr:DUF4214 domain-containing protein [Clostridiales bacterium]
MICCKDCGSENPDNAVFCLDCGCPLIEIPEDPEKNGRMVRISPAEFGESDSPSDKSGKDKNLVVKSPVIAVIAASVLISGGFIMFDRSREPKDDRPSLVIAETESGKEDLSDAGVTGISDCVYTGGEVIPEVTVELGGTVLNEGTDYRVIGVEDIFPGNASLMIFGIGDYEGEIYEEYRIFIDDPVCDDPDNSQIIAFVNRFYDSVYDRNASGEELIYWVNALYNRQTDGASIAEEFFSSEEIAGRGLSDEEFICLAYRVLLNRKAEPDGLSAWCNVLTEGTSRSEVVTMLASSVEFGNLCAMYGIDANV